MKHHRQHKPRGSNLGQVVAECLHDAPAENAEPNGDAESAVEQDRNRRRSLIRNEASGADEPERYQWTDGIAEGKHTLEIITKWKVENSPIFGELETH